MGRQPDDSAHRLSGPATQRRQLDVAVELQVVRGHRVRASAQRTAAPASLARTLRRDRARSTLRGTRGHVAGHGGNEQRHAVSALVQGIATAALLANAPVPENLSAIIDQYVGKLDKEKRVLLSAAAVCGDEGRIDTLARVLERDDLGSRTCANRLLREQLWLAPRAKHEADSRAGTYSFRHALFREVLTSAWRHPPVPNVTARSARRSNRSEVLVSASQPQSLGRLAELELPVHPHMLRHACGFVLANKGVDTGTIQDYLGRKSIQHTVKYTQLAPHDLEVSGANSAAGEYLARRAVEFRVCRHGRYIKKSLVASEIDGVEQSTGAASSTAACHKGLCTIRTTRAVGSSSRRIRRFAS